MHTETLLDYVLRRLEETRGRHKDISAASGVPYSTLTKIHQRVTPNPGVQQVQRLADYFRVVDAQRSAERAVKESAAPGEVVDAALLERRRVVPAAIEMSSQSAPASPSASDVVAGPGEFGATDEKRIDPERRNVARRKRPDRRSGQDGRRGSNQVDGA